MWPFKKARKPAELPPAAPTPSLGDRPVCPAALLDLALVMGAQWWPGLGFRNVEDIGMADAALERVFPHMAERGIPCECFGDPIGADSPSPPGDCGCDGAAWLRHRHLAGFLDVMAGLRDRPTVLRLPPQTIAEARANLAQAKLDLAQLELRALTQAVA